MENDFITNVIFCIIMLGGAGVMIAYFAKMVFNRNKYKYNGPRPYSFVRFKFENVDEEHKSYYTHFELEKNQRLIFISEIANMPGHCIITKTTRNRDESESVRTYTGYHTSDFVELTDEEV